MPEVTRMVLQDETRVTLVVRGRPRGGRKGLASQRTKKIMFAGKWEQCCSFFAPFFFSQKIASFSGIFDTSWGGCRPESPIFWSKTEVSIDNFSSPSLLGHGSLEPPGNRPWGELFLSAHSPSKLGLRSKLLKKRGLEAKSNSFCHITQSSSNWITFSGMLATFVFIPPFDWSLA